MFWRPQRRTRHDKGLSRLEIIQRALAISAGATMSIAPWVALTGWHFGGAFT